MVTIDKINGEDAYLVSISGCILGQLIKIDNKRYNLILDLAEMEANFVLESRDLKIIANKLEELNK